jgi:imidazolonepropionase-like amidohydrolase
MIVKTRGDEVEEAVVKAQRYLRDGGGPEDKRPARDLHLEALGRVLKIELPLLVTAHRVTDMAAALRLAKEFDIRIVTPYEALAAITIDAARILGIDTRVGSLEAGKDGDIALFDGDPFEYTTHVTGVVIEGQVVSDTVR